MNRQPIHLRRLACRVLVGLATLAGALLAPAAVPAAYASVPHFGRPAGTHTTVRFISTGGMPGWQVTLIAVAAAVLAAALAVALDRSRTARRQMRATTA
jgi:hypothetical protein